MVEEMDAIYSFGTWELVALPPAKSPVGKDKNIGFNGYISTWILRIYRIYQWIYIFLNINKSKINILVFIFYINISLS